MEEFGKIANNSNRNLQQSIRGFQERPTKYNLNRKIRDFKVSPEASKAYIKKVKEEAKKQQKKNLIFYVIMTAIIASLVYFFWYILPYLDF